MLKVIIAILLMLLKYEPTQPIEYDYVPTVEEYVSPTEWNAQKMRITCYVSSPNAHTYSGKKVFQGGCASNKENIGKIAYLYNENRELIGIYEVTDIGSNSMLVNGTALDLWQPDMAAAWAYINENTDYAWVIFVDADG